MTWQRGGRRRRVSSAPAPGPALEAWRLSMERARDAYDELVSRGYSDAAASAILSLAVHLWGDSARALEGGGVVLEGRPEGDELA